MSTFVYVGNLDRATTEEAVRAAFVSAGVKILSVVILKSPQNGRSRGFGFAELGTPEEAEEATRAMAGAEIDGKAIRVSAARERSPDAGQRNFQSYSGLGRPLSSRPSRGGGSKRRRN